MSQNRRQLIFGIQVGQNAASDKDLPSRQSDCTLEPRIWVKVKLIRKLTLSVCGDMLSHSLQVLVDFSRLRRGLNSFLLRESLREYLSHFDLFSVSDRDRLRGVLCMQRGIQQ